MVQKIRFAEVLKQLVDEKYRRNRATLAKEVHISPGAISQYVCGRTTPGLEVLVHLAEILDVSLDYLVLGRELGTQPELGYVTGRMEAHIRNTYVQAEALYNLIARIGNQTGARLGEQLATLVHSVAQELVNDGVSLAGTLSPDEVVTIESCDAETTIVSADLSSEILVLEQEGHEETTATGFFAQVVTENIAGGSRYEFILPSRRKLRHAGSLLRQEIIRLTNIDPATVDRRFQLTYVPNACVPGFVVHHVVIDKFRRRAAHLFEQTSHFICPNPGNEKIGYLAIVTPASPSYQRYCLIAKDDIPHVMNELGTIRRRAI
jgi:transcriptional regulator with XRE-family HTH domain